VNEEEAALWHRLIDAQVQTLHFWGDVLRHMADALRTEHEIIDCKLRLSRIQLRKETGVYESKAARADP